MKWRLFTSAVILSAALGLAGGSSAHAQTPPTLTADSFGGRSNSAPLGSTDGAGSLDPVAWQFANDSAWEIFNGGARRTSGTGGSLAWIDAGQAAHQVTATVVTKPAAGGAHGVQFRMLDGSNWWTVDMTADSIRLGLVVADGWNLMWSSSTGSAGDVIGARASGTTIEVLRNGSVIHTQLNATQHQSATKVGVRSHGETGLVVDNFQALDLSPQPDPTTTTTSSTTSAPSTTTTIPSSTTTTSPDSSTTTTTPPSGSAQASWDDGMQPSDFRAMAGIIGTTLGLCAGAAFTGRRY